ncbi:MAG: DUF5320 domain-containing protein [Bacteroidales bacterium]
MPGFNQKGPKGQGPMTGQRLGRCTNYGAKQNRQVSDEQEVSPEETQKIITNDPILYGRGRGGIGRGLGCQYRNMGRR